MMMGISKIAMLNCFHSVCYMLCNNKTLSQCYYEQLDEQIIFINFRHKYYSVQKLYTHYSMNCRCFRLSSIQHTQYKNKIHIDKSWEWLECSRGRKGRKEEEREKLNAVVIYCRHYCYRLIP